MSNAPPKRAHDDAPSTTPTPQKRTDPLPASARAKLIRIGGEASDARAAAQAASNRASELRQGLGYPDQPPENAPGIEIELTRLHAVRVKQDRRYRELAALETHLKDWLRGLSRFAVFEESRVGRISPRDDETLVQAIERLRSEIDDAVATVKTIELAPPPKSVLKEQAEAYVEALVKRGQPTVRVERNGIAIKFSDPAAYTTASPESVAAIVAWLHPAGMISKLWKTIDAMPEHPHAMTEDIKARKLVEARETLRQLERWECGMVERANEEGIDVLPRTDADPLAVLGIAPPKPVKAAKAKVAA